MNDIGGGSIILHGIHHFESEKVRAHLYPTSETWDFPHEPLVSIKGGVFDKLHILSTSHEGLRSMS
jgi:hypothetical protein